MSSVVPRSKYLAAVALVLLALSLIELIDVVNLPFESALGAGASSGSIFSVGFVSSFLAIGYTGLFALMAMESAAFPIPSEVVLPLAGYLAYLGKMNLALAVIDATIAGLAGALADYYLAMWLGRPVVYRLLGRVGVSSTHLDNAERWVDSKGAWSVFVARLVPGVRSVISIPAGLLRMKIVPFVALTVLGSFIWSALLIYIGYTAGPLWQNATNSFSASAGQAALVIIAALSVLYVIYYFGPFARKKAER
jgi:membrane protein DedA with SNARE-associated domain